MQPFAAHRVRRTGKIRVPAQVGEAFELFTPLGEKEWVGPSWDPQFRVPASGEMEPGAVFTTREPDGTETIWTTLSFDRALHQVSYLRTTPGSRVGRVDVCCQPAAELGTTAEMTYTFTALTPAGNDYLAAWTAERYAALMAEWEQKIAAALAARGVEV